MDEEAESTDSVTGHDAAPGAADKPVWQNAPAAAAAGDDPLDVSEDELTRVVSSLSRQRDALAARRTELDARETALDEREAALSEREDHIGAREDAVGDRENALGQADSTRSAQLDEDWQEKLSSFEETNRQYAEATTALADWAAELRGDAGGEPAAHEEPEAEEPESPPAVPDESADEDF